MDSIDFRHRGHKVTMRGEREGKDYTWYEIYLADGIDDLYDFFDDTPLLAELEEAATKAAIKQLEESAADLREAQNEAIEYRDYYERRCA